MYKVLQLKILLISSFIFLSSNLYSELSDYEINTNGFRTLAKEDIAIRDSLLKSIDKLLDDALKLDIARSTGRLNSKDNNMLNKITREIKKDLEVLKEVVRRIKLYSTLLSSLETKYQEGSKVKDFFVKEIASYSRSELYGLKDYPDNKENTVFFLNLSVALKSMEVKESEVWLFIKDFVEYITIAKPKSLSSFVSLKHTRKRTQNAIKKHNTIPNGLPLKVNGN
jgi:hypothetical protein